MPTYKENFLEQIEVRQPRLGHVPLVIDDWTLAFRLGFTGKVFWYIVENRHLLYKEFMVKKKSGGLRRTFDPSNMMRVFQSQLRANFLLPLVSRLGPHVSAYQVGKSTVDAARAHLRPCEICEATTQPNTNPAPHACLRRGVKFKLDLKDFFLSTSRCMIRQYFHRVVGYNHYASSLMGQIMTTNYTDEKRRNRAGVPPGALTAGDICNLVADWLIDQPMMAALPGWTYTRYADDLYFSHDQNLDNKVLGDAIQKAAAVIKESGYRVNWKKLQVQRWSRPQRFLGVNINRKLNIPANEFDRMHTLLYKAHKLGFTSQLVWADKEEITNLHAWITGKINYFNQFAPHKAGKLKRLYDQAKAAHHIDDNSVFEFVNGEVVDSRPVEEI